MVINKLYFYTKNYKINDRGSLWQPDPLLSYKGIPNSKGTQDYYIGDSIKGGIYTEFDSIGFRVVKTQNRLNYNTLNLFLGCSFTYGTNITAEESFTYKTSKMLGNSYINAGGTGYGIGQMKILLDTLISKYKFKYVFLQLSPWLTDRAMKISAPLIYFYRPIPYFSDDNEFKLNYSAYENTSMSYTYNWNISKTSYSDKFKFILTDGMKIELLDYMRLSIAKLKVFLGILPKPAKNRESLEKYFYEYAINKCKENHAIPVVLKLCYPDSNAISITNYLKDKCIIIDLDKDLNQKVIDTGKSYYELYSIYHVHKGKHLIFDTHPNALANDIISQKIYSILSNN